jgi:hypothetical protein
MMTAAAVGMAAATLAACNPNQTAQNGAYVGGSNDSSLATPASGPPGPPPQGSYQAVARTPPPPLPVYDQPPAPEPGWMWTPGYWAWSDEGDDYYWTPGVWVEPPSPGLYWTPGYWRYNDGEYLWSAGYWGPQVGFYGGVDYGFGYGGAGYIGGQWRDGQFWYNRSVNNVDGLHARTVYDQPAFALGRNRASYNGGPGGVRAAPTQAQVAASQQRHAPPTRAQVQALRLASADPQQRATANRGAPPVAAMQRPQAFRGAGAVVSPTRSAATYRPPSPSANPRVATRTEPGVPPAERRPVQAERGADPFQPARTQPVQRSYTAREPAPMQRPAPTVRAAPAYERRAQAGPRPAAPAFHAAPAPRPAPPPVHAAPAQHPQAPPAEERKRPQ